MGFISDDDWEYIEGVKELAEYGLDHAYVSSVNNHLSQLVSREQPLPWTLRHLLKEMKRSTLIYISDWHHHRRDKKLVCSAINALSKKSQTFQVMIEVIPAEQQPRLDDFLTNESTGAALMNEVRDEEDTFYQSYARILDDAKKARCRIFGLKTIKGVNQMKLRDEDMASIIVSQARVENQQTIVFAGECHLADAHLPQRVREKHEEKGIQRKELFIFQDNEILYDRLGRGIFKVGNVFAYNSVHPAVKYRRWERSNGLI